MLRLKPDGTFTADHACGDYDIDAFGPKNEPRSGPGTWTADGWKGQTGITVSYDPGDVDSGYQALREGTTSKLWTYVGDPDNNHSLCILTQQHSWTRRPANRRAPSFCCPAGLTGGPHHGAARTRGVNRPVALGVCCFCPPGPRLRGGRVPGPAAARHVRKCGPQTRKGSAGVRRERRITACLDQAPHRALARAERGLVRGPAGRRCRHSGSAARLAAPLQGRAHPVSGGGPEAISGHARAAGP